MSFWNNNMVSNVEPVVGPLEKRIIEVEKSILRVQGITQKMIDLEKKYYEIDKRIIRIIEDTIESLKGGE